MCLCIHTVPRRTSWRFTYNCIFHLSWSIIYSLSFIFFILQGGDCQLPSRQVCCWLCLKFNYLFASSTRSSLLICGELWHCEVTSQAIADPDSSLQHTLHAFTHTHTAFLRREARLRENRPPTVLRLKKAEASQLSVLQVEKISDAWDFYLQGEAMRAVPPADLKSTYAMLRGTLKVKYRLNIFIRVQGNMAAGCH